MNMPGPASTLLALLPLAPQGVTPLPGPDRGQVLPPVVPQLLSSFGTCMVEGGGRLLIGAPGQDVAGNVDLGAVHAYRSTSGGSWEPSSFLGPGSGSQGYGASLALQGNTLAVGQTGGNGKVFVHRHAPGGLPPEWPIVQEIPAQPAQAALGRDFGASVALWQNTLFVGDPVVEAKASVRVFVRPAAQQPYVLTDSLTTPQGFANGGEFGRTLALSEGVLAVGGSADVWLYGQEGGSWSAFGFLPDVGRGGALAIADDVLAVVQNDGSGVSVHERDAGGPGAWGEVALLTPPANPANWGTGLALGGARLFVSSYDGSGTGRVFVYRRERPTRAPSIWRFEQVLRPRADAPWLGRALEAHEGGVLASELATVGGVGAVHELWPAPADLGRGIVPR